MQKIIIALFVMFGVLAANAGEITFTGRAGLGGNAREAQRSSLNSALIGGLRRYVQVNAPRRNRQINSDYLMFINSYVITSRTISGGGVNTTVRMSIDDMILDDTSAYITAGANAAVFQIAGLPGSVPVNGRRANIRAVFDKYQFTTNDQIAFEQELLGSNRRQDALTAFEAIGAQYLFDLKFEIKDAPAGSCTLATAVSYVHEDNVSNIVSVLKTETTLENPDPDKCVLAAATAATDSALAHMRNKIAPAPKERIETYTYRLRFTNIHDLLSINELLRSLQSRKMINRSEQVEFLGNETTFEVNSYLLPEDLAKRISTSQFSGVSAVGLDEANPQATATSTPILITMGAATAESGDGQ